MLRGIEALLPHTLLTAAHGPIVALPTSPPNAPWRTWPSRAVGKFVYKSTFRFKFTDHIKVPVGSDAVVSCVTAEAKRV